MADLIRARRDVFLKSRRRRSAPRREPQARKALYYAEKEALFTFLTHDGVDATNWRAEQAIRPAVREPQGSGAGTGPGGEPPPKQG